MTAAAPFEYRAAATWEEAVELLGELGDEAVILAGGQSLVPLLNLRLAMPAALIDVNPIPTPEPAVDGDMLVLGALTRHQTLLRSPLIARHCPMLPAAVKDVGNVRVRARGTIGGSLCQAHPSGELPCAVTALGGTLTVRGARGIRTIPVGDFIEGYLTTALDEGEVVTEVRLPIRRPGEGWGFAEIARRPVDFAIVEVAAIVRFAGDKIAEARIVVGGVEEKPRAVDTTMVIGTAGGEADLRSLAVATAGSLRPGSDHHASAEHRTRLTRVLTHRALAQAVERART
jgi:CO/xanthine dehydrogenase FAD-binding subunit